MAPEPVLSATSFKPSSSSPAAKAHFNAYAERGAENEGDNRARLQLLVCSCTDSNYPEPPFREIHAATKQAAGLLIGDEVFGRERTTFIEQEICNGDC